jgi:hypothetical protein
MTVIAPLLRKKMTYLDPHARGLKMIIDSASDALTWLVEEATGHHSPPRLHSEDLGYVGAVADFLDQEFGEAAVNTIINATFIDRGADFVFKVAARNPRLAPALVLKPFITDLLKIGFSSAYRGKPIGDAVVNRILSKYAGLHLEGWLPEAKSFAAAVAAKAARMEYGDE